jgi:hypothetical protein
MVVDYNPGLTRNRGAGDDKGGPATIELPDKIENISWQTRAAVPTEREQALADALQAIFAAEIYELPAIVEQLNKRKLAAPDGAPAWTEENFRAEVARLGV